METSPLSHLKRLILPLLLFSFIGNLAVLVSPIFMMQVLDRVVPSGNVNTLIMLLCVALGAIVAHSFVELQRDLCLERTARWIEKIGAGLVVRLRRDDRQVAISDVGALTQFFRSGTAKAALSLPWLPLFILALALIHPLFVILLVAVVGAMLLLSALQSVLTGGTVEEASKLRSLETQVLRDASDPYLSAGLRAIGANLLIRFQTVQSMRHERETSTAATSNRISAILGGVRMASQLLALSLGATLVISGGLTAGGMIGASIIMAKTVQIAESAMSTFNSARQTKLVFSRLQEQFESKQSEATEITDLSGGLTARDLIYPRGGGAPARIDRVSLQLAPGECLAIVGDSGSGKTTLLHALAGIDPCPIGAVFLDETEIRTIGPWTEAKSIGFLPQQARLIKGSLAENISCFAPGAPDVKLIRAAKTAGVHGLISALPEAYETDIGTHPHLLSAGQKQRVALARAIYERPKYLFLDEPNALLDASGERQLCDTLALLKSNGTTIVMVLHRSGIMGLADKVLMLDHGRVADFGSRTEVLGRMSDRKRRIKLPLLPTSLQDLNDWIEAQFLRNNDGAFCQKAVLIGTEIFNVASQEASADLKHGIFTFKFVDDTHCEISMQEDGKSKIAEKMPKIKSLINHPQVDMLDLPSDEIGLAMLTQMTTRFEVKNHKQGTVFFAALSSENVSLEGVPKH
ncbi:MAG: ATP-binding cassette domain-containing protein [Pseudoruegeria sp.]